VLLTVKFLNTEDGMDSSVSPKGKYLMRKQEGDLH
jgi:hypothetical protein